MAEDIDQATLKSLKKSLEALKEEAKDYRDIMEDNETFMSMLLDKRAENVKKEIAQEKAKSIALQEQINNTEEKYQKAFIDSKARIDGNIQDLERQLKSQNQQTRAIKKTTAEMMGMTEVYGRHEVVTIDLVARMAKMGMTLTSITGIIGVTAGAVGGLFNTIIALSFEVDKTSSSLMKQTGINRELADSMIVSQRETARLGVEVEDQANAFNALFTTYTDFSLQSESVQQEITKTTAVLEKLGIANQDVATGVQNTTKFFGQTGEAAIATARDLASFASTVGLAPKELAKDFASAGGSLAKLGSDGVRAFKDLAVASKITGIEVNKLIQITDKFDTFEGAATQAGKLNAALGGNFVNAMDLMTATDPIERFEMLRDSILNTGLTFDDMSYYQRKFFTEAAGLDNVGDLAKMMSGNFSDLAGAVNMSSADYADLEERAKELQSVQEELKNTIRALIPVVQPLLEEFRNLAKSISENEPLLEKLKTSFKVIGDFALVFVENLGLIASAMAAAFGVTAINGVIQFVTGTNLLGKGMDLVRGKLGGLASKIPGLGKIFGSTDAAAEGAAGSFQAMSNAATGLAEFGEKASRAIESMGEAAKKASANLAKMVKPILAIGVSVGVAAFGVSYLVEAFGGLEGAQIAGAVLGILALGAALAIFAKFAFVAVIPASGLATAILAVGAAVAIAAFGLSYLVNSFKGLETSLETFVGFALIIGVFTLSALKLGAVGAAASGPIYLLAGALAFLALSFAGVGVAMMPFNQFVSGMSSLVANIEGLRLVKKEIIAISNAMANVPANAGASIQATAALAGNFSAAPTNISFKPEQTIVLEIDGAQFNTKIRDVVGKDVIEYMDKK